MAWRAVVAALAGASRHGPWSLVAAIWGLLLSLDRHLDVVAQRVAPHVERLHGAECVRQLRDERAIQRNRVVELVNRCDGAARRRDGSLVVAAEHLVDSLRNDLAREEHLLDIAQIARRSLAESTA